MARVSVFVMWILSALVISAFIFQPVGVNVQIVISISTLVILTILTRFGSSGLVRHVILASASIIILRYAYWRTTSTLPPFEDLWSFVPGMILYVAEMFCIVMFAISLFVISDPLTRKKPPVQNDDELPSVDVFVPTYNEDREILALTLAAAKAMEYPKDRLQVYLLDDGATDQKRNHEDSEIADAANSRAGMLKDLCADLGVTYLTRTENTHAKAGNLNAGLSRTNGEIVVVFDADHAPERNFLKETIGYFAADPDLFLVQTPHYFSNPDPVERNMATFSKMPSENEMFYSNIQKGLDRWNASFFCGSAALLRREALEDVGGFSGITITEDCETALELHSRGWNSVYVDKPLVSGLQPETFASFIGQRSRWCQGMVQILLLKNPLFKSGLSLPQKLCYLSSALFWFFPLVRMTFLIAPVLFIFFNLKIFNASAQEFFAYTVTYLIASEMIRNYLYGTVRWPWISELYEYVQSVYLLRAIVTVIFNPRRPSFNVTAKGQTLDQKHLSELALPFFLIFGFLVVVLYVGFTRYQTEPALGDLIIITGFWNLVNLVIAGAALGVIIEQRSDVSGIDMPVKYACELLVGEKAIPVTVLQASARRAEIRIKGDAANGLRKGDYGRLSLVNAPNDVLISTIPVFIGKSMTDAQNMMTLDLDADAKHFPAIAELMLHDMEISRSNRAGLQVRRGFIVSLFVLLKWALLSPFAALSAALASKGAAGKARSRKQVSARKTNQAKAA